MGRATDAGSTPALAPSTAGRRSYHVVSDSTVAANEPWRRQRSIGAHRVVDERPADGGIRAAWRREHLVRRARRGPAAGAAAPGRGRRAGLRAQHRRAGGAVSRLHPGTARHGHTPDADGPITYQLMATDTIAFLERVVGGPAHLV